MKNIRGKLVVAAGVAVAVTGVVIARAQFVSLDGSAMHVASQHVDSTQRVTKSFDRTPAREVVEWARARNLPLTIADSDIPAREVTLTLTDVDPVDVGPLLADALGMQAKKEGDRYVLAPCDGPDIEINADSLPQIAELASMPEIPQVAEGMPMPPVDMIAEIPQVFEKIKKEMGLKDLKDIEKADEKTKQRFKELVEKHMGEWGKDFEKKFNSKDYERKMEAWGKDFAKKFDSPEFKAKMDAWAKKFDSPEFKEKMEKFGEDFGKQFDSPEWKAKMQAWEKEWNSPEHKAQMDKWAQEMKAHAGEMKMNDEQMKRLHEQMERLHKELGDGKAMKAFALDAKAMADMERNHAFAFAGGQQVVIVGPDGKKQTLELKGGEGPVVITLSKDGTYKVVRAGKDEKGGPVILRSSNDGKYVVIGPDGKAKTIELKAAGKEGTVLSLGKDGAYTVVGPDGKKQTLKLKSGDGAFAIAGPDKLAHFAMTGDKIKKLVSSLTDTQKELMKKQGFLTPADLAPAQRELLGDMGKGDFEFSFSIDGQSVRIKNKEPKAAGSVGV